MRCNHPGTDAPSPSLSPFLLEPDPSSVAFVLHSGLTPASRPEPLAGFGQVESPPPRTLLLAI